MIEVEVKEFIDSHTLDISIFVNELREEDNEDIPLMQNNVFDLDQLIWFRNC